MRLVEGLKIDGGATGQAAEEEGKGKGKGKGDKGKGKGKGFGPMKGGGRGGARYAPY